uniref:Candidate secreted effector n=1 Tax=Meloidogyne incognita TaxID=6306 RepID=A0A914N491_MELIC
MKQILHIYLGLMICIFVCSTSFATQLGISNFSLHRVALSCTVNSEVIRLAFIGNDF